MAKQVKKVEKPAGYKELKSFGNFDLSSGQFQHSSPVWLSDGLGTPIKGIVYRYPLAENHVYFVDLEGNILENMKFYNTL